MKIVVAPNGFAAAARSFLVLGAMLLVAAAMFAAKGSPRSSRDVGRNEIEEFAPRLVEGVSQLGVQTLIVIVVAWGCREGLKIRL